MCLNNKHLNCLCGQWAETGTCSQWFTRHITLEWYKSCVRCASLTVKIWLRWILPKCLLWNIIQSCSSDYSQSWAGGQILQPNWSSKATTEWRPLGPHDFNLCEVPEHLSTKLSTKVNHVFNKNYIWEYKFKTDKFY